MLKINNKGFLLAETLITTCIIAVLATSLYVYVSKAIDNYEKRDNYDNIVDIYALNNYKIFFENHIQNDWGSLTAKYKPDKGKCTKEISGSDDFSFKFLSHYPENLYICDVSNGDYKNYVINSSKFSDGFKEYVRLLPNQKNDTNEDTYLIIAEFSSSMGRKKTYASLKTNAFSETENSDGPNIEDNPDASVDTSGANEPVLASGMIPVVYDGTKDIWMIADTKKVWYNYDKQMWANAVTTSNASYRTAEAGTEIPMEDINSMWVWIPRYKYRIPSDIGAGTSNNPITEPPEIDVVFESGTNTTGESLANCPIDATDCYYTHPAFRNGSSVYKSTAYDQGGWDEELEGIWVGKFETSGTSTTPTIKPDVAALRSQTMLNQFSTSLKFAGGTRNTSNGTVTFSGNSTYGLTSSTDTHMMKNTEWGAVAYLSQSKYGKMGNPNYSGANKEIYINNSSGYYTGRSGGGPSTTPINGTYPDQTSTTNYNTYGFYTYDDYLLNYNTNTNYNTKGEKVEGKGTGASTTGTIYGIYDMSGGAYDRTMGNWAGTVGYSGFTIRNLPGGSNGSKYYEKYTGISSSGMLSTNSIKGDATYETMRWYSGNAHFPYASHPWSSRGGYYSNTSYAGAFSSSKDNGASSSYGGFRVVLIP